MGHLSEWEARALVAYDAREKANKLRQLADRSGKVDGELCIESARLFDELADCLEHQEADPRGWVGKWADLCNSIEGNDEQPRPEDGP